MKAHRWKLQPSCPRPLLEASAGYPPLLVQILYNRGLSNPLEFEPFLAGDCSLSHDPLTLPDMPQAVSRIFTALLRGEKTLVFGDFDVDGVTATAMLVEGLESMGADVSAYLPHRTEEGHGLNAMAIAEFERSGVSLVVTVDCGITSAPEVEMARQAGIDVVVTDHHTVAGEMPRACAVVNPKRPDSRYACPHLAGVGVAFKLLEALTAGSAQSWAKEDAFSLIALGTIADMSPLTGENRYLVKRGIEAICASRRPGLAALIRSSGLAPEKISSSSIAWDLVPKLNAAGRIDHARMAYRLLHTDSEQEAEELAESLSNVNRERQALLEACVGRAREQVLATQAGCPMIMICDPEFPAGVCGLVANRLVDEFRRPTVVVRTGEDISRGSCRTIPEFDIIGALNRCSDLLGQYGGHPAAAGFSMDTGKLAALRERLTVDAAGRLEGLDLSPLIVIDAEAQPAEVTGETFRQVQRLAPFGQGNRQPLFLARAVELVDARPVGGGGQHLKMRLRAGGTMWHGIGFDLAPRYEKDVRLLDIVYSSQVNRWNGSESLELNVADFRRAEGRG